MDHMWARAKSTGRPCQRANEIQIIPAARHGGILCDSSGLADAKAGKPPYFWGLLTNPAGQDMLKDGWKSVGRVFILAVVLDIIYQLTGIAFYIYWRNVHRRLRSGDRAALFCADW